MRGSLYLLDEPPLVLQPSLAKNIGLNEAIVLQQIHYWITHNMKNNKNFYDGKYWTYNSITKWQQNEFIFMSIRTVERVFKNLEQKGILIVGNYNKEKRDRTSWYSIDYEVLDKYSNCIPPNWRNANRQNEEMHLPNLGEPLPDTTTYIKNDDDDGNIYINVRAREEVKNQNSNNVDNYDLAKELIENYLKRKPSESEIEYLLQQLKNYSLELVKLALTSASEAPTPTIIYLKGVFRNFYKRKIKTEDDFWKYEFERDKELGRI